MPRVFASLRERGFKGIEAYYGGTDAATRSLMVKLTRDAGMIPTGGSDYHGIFKSDVSLGVGHSGDLRVPDEILDRAKKGFGIPLLDWLGALQPAGAAVPISGMRPAFASDRWRGFRDKTEDERMFLWGCLCLEQLGTAS